MNPESFKALIENLNETPGHRNSTSETDLKRWREHIDLLDEALLVLLNERSRSANAIGKIKKELGMAVYVPSREEQVLDHVKRSNKGPLPDRAVRNLFERIIDETRSLERHMFQRSEKDLPHQE